MKKSLYYCSVLFLVYFFYSMAGGIRLPWAKESGVKPLAEIQDPYNEIKRRQQAADDKVWQALAFPDKMTWLEQNYESEDSNILDAVLRRIPTIKSDPLNHRILRKLDTMYQVAQEMNLELATQESFELVEE